MILSKYSKAYGKAPKCIDLFCGAGGLSLGFAQAGGIPVAAVDCDKNSIETYSKMFKVCDDVQCVNIEEWKLKNENIKVDVIIGGPPCQGFSIARGTRFVDDPRNSLYKYFVKTVAKMQPEWIVMENVPGIISIGGGVILQQIYQDFYEIGYILDHRVINMAGYGVPQTRKRAFFVGHKLGKTFEWPEPNYVPLRKNDVSWNDNNFITVDMALGDLPWPKGRYFSHRANSQMRGPRNRDVSLQPAFTLRVRGDEFAICEKPASGAFPPGVCPERELVYRTCQNQLQETMREDPPSWITDYKKAPIQNTPIEYLQGTRRLDVREQARLQTFPDWFQFCGTRPAQGRQIGNAVPPLFARQLFTKIFEQL